MFKRNLDEYKEKYQDIPKDRIERIQSYIDKVGFSSKDLEKFDKEVKRIKSIGWDSIKLIFYMEKRV